jgi:hypothetical protein
MPKLEYNRLWKKIANLPRQPTGESFWQEVESTLNNVYAQLFMGALHTGQTEDVLKQYIIGLDDDKIHYNYQRNVTNSDGLKLEHHAKDNRDGYTAHSAVKSESGAPICIHFQRSGEKIIDVYKDMMRKLFGRHQGQAVDLRNVIAASDRGCLEAKLLFWLLNAGADIRGTIKRMDWVPLSYDKSFPEKFLSKPKVIPKKGYKDSHRMTLEWKGVSCRQELSCISYRSGSGTSVALVVSSCIDFLTGTLYPLLIMI